MPARTDHDRRDAQSAARGEIAVYMQAYVRRFVARAYALIEEEATGNDSGDPVDWITVGKAAAYHALEEQGVNLPDHARAIVAVALPSVQSAALEPPGS